MKKGMKERKKEHVTDSFQILQNRKKEGKEKGIKRKRDNVRN